MRRKLSQNAPLGTPSYQDRGERVVNTPQFRVLLRAEYRIDAQVIRLTGAGDRLDAVIAHSESPASGCTRMAAEKPLRVTVAVPIR